MHNRIQATLRAVLIAGIVGLFALPAGQALADSPGIAHFVRFNDSSFDTYTSEPSLSMQTWLNTHIWRLGVYSPYFDDKTSWYPNGWVYRDAYAIYTNSSLASEHPEWILRSSSGEKLYIPWGCSSGTCPQYAGDISNPAFRRYWIEHAGAEYAKGYRGVFIDDVNMEMRVSNGSEEPVAPIDPSTGQAMTSSAWRAYMATFMQEVRAALPTAELVHNVIWFADEHAGISDPSIRSELSAANFAFLERGVNDSGLTGGTGPWSVNALLSYIDEIHSLGRGVVLYGSSGEAQGLEYNLAAYFLASTGNDAVSGKGQTPENWWAGWNVNLGEPSAPRYTWDNLLRRDFSGGMVLLNPPGAATETVTLSTAMEDVNGKAVTSVTLPAASGAILTGAGATVSTTTETSTSGTTSSTTSSTSETTSTTETTGTTTSTHGKGGLATKGKAHTASVAAPRPRARRSRRAHRARAKRHRRRHPHRHHKRHRR
jgi:hypothetical protein